MLLQPMDPLFPVDREARKQATTSAQHSTRQHQVFSAICGRLSCVRHFHNAQLLAGEYWHGLSQQERILAARTAAKATKQAGQPGEDDLGPDPVWR